MLHEIKLTARALLKRPAFSLVVILTLGLGLGANATLLSVADAILLRPLPYPEPDRLAALYETVKRNGLEERRTFSYPDFTAVRDGVSAFQSIAAIEGDSFVATSSGEGALRLRGAWVSPAYFDVLAAVPQRGRVFAPEHADDLERSAAAEVVLSHGFWQRHYAALPEALGDVLELDGDPYSVIGVMPEGFGDDSGYDVWLPILHLGPDTFNLRRSRSYGVIARLSDDATFEQARQQVEAVFVALEQDHPDSNIGYRGLVLSLRQDTVGDLERPVLLLGGAVGLLLLLAGFNVANMLLVESLRRRRPAAIRLALGASPWHLFRQTLVETLLLAVAGAGLGLLIAAWGLPVLDRLSPVRLPSWASAEVNLRVALATLGGVGLLGAVLAVITALSDAGPTYEIARHGNRTVGVAGGGNPLRRALLVAQIALAFIVATGAVLLTSSWLEWSRIDPGFSERELVFFRATLPTGEDEALLASGRELLAAARSVPGVESVSLASEVPLAGGYSATVVAAEGTVPRPDDAYGGGHRTYRHLVSSDYFETFGIPIVRGRGFIDGESTPGPDAAVVSGQLAERLWPGQDPIGRRFRFGPPRQEVDPETRWIEVVGVVDEVRHRNLRPDPERMAEDPDLYLSLDQFPTRSVTCAARVSGQVDERMVALRAAVEPMSARTPFYAWRTLDDHLESELRMSRFSTLMMGLFATLALVLAAVGVYGIFSHRVGERTREIGVRMALGAGRGRVLSWLLADAAVTVAAGVALGWLGALGFGHYFEGLLGDMLYGVTANDPKLFAAVSALVVCAATSACILPARQATRVDPQVVLREQ